MMIKRVFLVFAFCLAYLSGVFAQSPQNDPLKNAVVTLFKNSGEVVFNKDSADYVRIIRPDTSAQFLYLVNEFYMDGKTKMVGTSLMPSSGLKRQGPFIEYFHNGHRKSIINYENGEQTGDFAYYYPNGKIYYTGTYDKDKKQAVISEARDTSGAVTAQNGSGKWITYDDDFKHITGEGPIVNGLKEGEWRGTTTDSIQYVCTYAKGESVSGVSHDKSGAEYHFTKDWVVPEFKGGEKALWEFLQTNLHYPALARENNVQGKVWLSFVIKKNGDISKIKILNGIGSGCDDEALRFMRLSPPWTPGIRYGVPVSDTYVMPISFVLQNDN
ncbi:MAG TPA: TonB family protein [Mucilaginibacter sp.]|nr:TonB family protein [Mucilaginibacter sp.]